MSEIDKLIEDNDKKLEEYRNKIEYRFDNTINTTIEDSDDVISCNKYLFYCLIFLSCMCIGLLCSFIVSIVLIYGE